MATATSSTAGQGSKQTCLDWLSYIGRASPTSTVVEQDRRVMPNKGKYFIMHATYIRVLDHSAPKFDALRYSFDLFCRECLWDHLGVGMGLRSCHLGMAIGMGDSWHGLC